MTRLLNVMVPGNLALHLDFDGYVPQAMAHERALLRVCQEAVSNVIRHAEARRVKVAVRIDDRRVHLRIHDDGRGVGADTPRGFGFASMVLGAWQVNQGEDEYLIVFAAPLNADADPNTLQEVVEAVTFSTDRIEKQLSEADAF